MKLSLVSFGTLSIVLATAAGAAERTDVVARATFRPAEPLVRISDLAVAAADLTPAERHQLGPLSSHEFRTLAETTPGQPPRIGLARHLAQPLELRALPSFPAARTRLASSGGLLRREPDGSRTWTLSVSSTGAAAMRLHFDSFLLPEGARAYVYSSDGEAHGPYTNELVRRIVPDGRDFWTNSVYASTIYLEVRFAGASSPLDLSLDAAGHLEFSESLAAAEVVANPEATECFVDVACAQDDATLIQNLSRAAAQLNFMKNSSFYACSGSLVNVSKTPEVEPYMLTANHCFDSQASASSIEALWDYRPSSCGGTPPDPSTLPRSLGANLLISGVSSDFTLIELVNPPQGTRSLLGWNANMGAIADGTTFYRVAHPSGGPQRFSRNSFTQTPSPIVCSQLPQSSFLYSRGTYGGTTGGSSGAPMTNAAGEILGQLFGKCGDFSNPCSYTPQSTVDGAFAVTYPFISAWLDPSAGAEACSAAPTTLCVQSNRFRITLSARDPRTGRADSGYVMSSTDVFGYFAFPVLTGNQTDPQVFVKVLDGRPINNRWWVFYASLTDLEFSLTVTDTESGVVKGYYQAPYTQKSANDTSAFN